MDNDGIVGSMLCLGMRNAVVDFSGRGRDGRQFSSSHDYSLPEVGKCPYGGNTTERELGRWTECDVLLGDGHRRMTMLREAEGISSENVKLLMLWSR